MGWPAYQDNWRAEEKLAVQEFLMKAADGIKNVKWLKKIWILRIRSDAFVMFY